MEHSATMRVLFTLMVAILAQPFISYGVQPVLAAKTYGYAPPLTDVAAPDSAYPSTPFPGYTDVLYFSGTNCGTTTSRVIEIWLKFDISQIPPQSTILSATLYATTNNVKVSANVGVHFASDSTWSQSSIDWNNAPASSISSNVYSSNSISNPARTYQWDVTQILVAYNPTYNRITLVLYPTSSQGLDCNGWISFTSSSISLSVTYSYASTSVSISSSSINYGASVTIAGSTDPLQSGGTMTLEYSTDQAAWNILQTQSGGTSALVWTPPSAGTYYFKTVWSISWSSGSYSTSSLPVQLSVTRAPSTVQLSISSNTITVGRSVTLTVNFISPPSVPDGLVTILYSTDGNIWNTLVSAGPSSGSWGNYVYLWTPPSVGTYYFRAYWGGDQNYLASPYASQTLTVTLQPTSIRLLAPSSARLDQQVTVTATLLDSSSNPIPSAQLSFQFGSVTVGTGTTNSAGIASLTFTPSVSAATYVITVAYVGSSQYQGSTSQSTIQIIPWQLVISSSAPTVSLVAVNNQNYTTDSTGRIVIQIPRSGAYNLHVNSPLNFSLGSRYAFVQWGDGSTALTRTINIASDTSLSIIVKIQYKLTIQSPYGSSTGDDWYDSGSNAQFTIHSPVDQQNGTRRVFLGWNKNSQPFSSPANGSLTMTGPATLQANWKKQYFLTITSQYGSPSGGGWNDADSLAKVTVQSPFNTTAGVRYVLTGYVGTGAAPPSGNVAQVVFTISLPSSLTFSWKPQYFISIQSSGGTTSGGGSWYDGGTTVTITATSPSAVIQNVSRLIFVGWTGIQSSNKTIQFKAGQPYNITANWVQQYYVSGLTTMGQIEGTGWYNKSSSATLKVSPTAFGFLIQQVFNGWVDQHNNTVPDQGGVSTFVVSGPVNLHATWRTDYTQLIVLVAVVAGGSGAGGFYFFRKRKGQAPRRETAAKVEPQPMEPGGQTVVERQPQPEIGTSVYTGSACPACGTVNPVGAVYCGSCGADLQRQKN